MFSKHTFFSFQGRIGRQTYWLASLLLFAVFFVVFMALAMLVASLGEETAAAVFGIVYLLSMPFIIWISLAIQVKRWHDRDKSGWMALVNFIPVIGPIWVLVECGFLKGTEGSNQYGNAVV